MSWLLPKSPGLEKERERAKNAVPKSQLKKYPPPGDVQEPVATCAGRRGTSGGLHLAPSPELYPPAQWVSATKALLVPLCTPEPFSASWCRGAGLCQAPLARERRLRLRSHGRTVPESPSTTLKHLQPHKPPPGALSEEGSRDISSAFLTHAPRCNQERPKPSPWHQGSIPAKCRSYRKGKIPAEAVTGLKRPKRQTGGNLCHAAPSLEPCCLYLPHHKTQPLIFPWNNGGLLALWQQAQKGSRVCCGQATSWGLKQQCWAILGHRSCCYTRTSQQSTRDGHTVGEHSPLPARP